MRLDELPTSNRIEDRRGLTTSRAGGIGVGTIVVLGLIGWALGIDPRLLIGGAEMMSRNGQTQQQTQVDTGTPSDETGRFVSAILGSTEAEWKEVFDQAGKSYQPPTLVMFSGATQSGCGFARSAMGPFYCPVDQKVYLDTSFFQDLERRFRGCDVGSKTCQFSQAYVIAHEIGHHVQNLLGILPKVQQAKEGVEQAEANALQVRVLCHDATPVHTAKRNCTRDEGGPFGFGNQVLISSHRKLLWSKAMVVSVAETPGQDFGRQGRERRAQANRCRSVESGLGDVETGG